MCKMIAEAKRVVINQYAEVIKSHLENIYNERESNNGKFAFDPFELSSDYPDLIVKRCVIAKHLYCYEKIWELPEVTTYNEFAHPVGSYFCTAYKVKEEQSGLIDIPFWFVIGRNGNTRDYAINISNEETE